MADDPVANAADTQPVEGGDIPASADLGETPAGQPDWSRLWQVPTIAGAIGLIAWGLVLLSSEAPTNDFDAALAQVEELIADHRLDLAKTRLKEVIEPNLAEATDPQRGRFHAVAADWLVESQDLTGSRSREGSQLIIGHYRKARDLGATLNPARLEYLAFASMAVGDIETAQACLEQLDVLDLADATGPEVRARRNRVLRALVERAVAEPKLRYAEIIAALVDYRSDDRVSLWDHQWAIAREAELRIIHGQAHEAVSRLLVEMRRLEHRAGTDPFNFGELYMLLGRGYYEMGEFANARASLDRALESLTHADAALGDAEELVGVLDVSDGDFESALEHFGNVVQHYVDSAAALRATLGRADALSRLGRHDESLEAYKSLRDAPAVSGVVPTPETIGDSLLERVDSALVLGDIDLALRYAEMAETFFNEDTIPSNLLHRLAIAHRQRAENLVPGAVPDPEAGPALTLTSLEPGPRYEASLELEKAANYAVRHARAMRLISESDDVWGESLWLAADSYDLAGLHEKAITHFREYLGGSGQVARRAEAQYRLSQAFEATFDFESAIEGYETVINEYERSPQAFRSHVPLARCLIAAEREEDAERQLLRVLSGDQSLQPDAPEFRTALIELGVMFHDAGRYEDAITRLDQVVKRYPDDDRLVEVRFRLADCYRARSLELLRPDEGAPTVPRSERVRLETLRRDHLERALNGFHSVVASYEKSDPRSLDAYQQDLLRNAYLYRGDCAFDLGRFKDAIDLYDQAASRFREHHSSMHALIQIYNCYSELKDVEGARNAHRRALVRLSQLPDNAFDSADALMDRTAWERWLSNSPVQTASATEAN